MKNKNDSIDYAINKKAIGKYKGIQNNFYPNDFLNHHRVVFRKARCSYNPTILFGNERIEPDMHGSSWQLGESE